MWRQNALFAGAQGRGGRDTGGTVAEARDIELGVIVVAVEARASNVHLRQVRGSRSTASMGFSFLGPVLRRNATVAISPATGMLSALRRSH